jgi:hypothetical protein
MVSSEHDLYLCNIYEKARLLPVTRKFKKLGGLTGEDSYLFLIIIDILLSLCLFGWSIWKHMVQIF